jgi:PqqD family protein of HPr-rel-A system
MELPRKDMDAAWRGLETDDLLWSSWGDEFIVYRVASGDTHQLSPLAVDVLQVLQQAPASIKQLTEHIAAVLQVPCDHALMVYVEDILATLKRSGLIEPMHP